MQAVGSIANRIAAFLSVINNSPADFTARRNASAGYSNHIQAVTVFLAQYFCYFGALVSVGGGIYMGQNRDRVLEQCNPAMELGFSLAE